MSLIPLAFTRAWRLWRNRNLGTLFTQKGEVVDDASIATKRLTKNSVWYHIRRRQSDRERRRYLKWLHEEDVIDAQPSHTSVNSVGTTWAVRVPLPTQEEAFKNHLDSLASADQPKTPRKKRHHVTSLAQRTRKEIYVAKLRDRASQILKAHKDHKRLGCKTGCDCTMVHTLRAFGGAHYVNRILLDSLSTICYTCKRPCRVYHEGVSRLWFDCSDCEKKLRTRSSRPCDDYYYEGKEVSSILDDIGEGLKPASALKEEVFVEPPASRTRRSDKTQRYRANKKSALLSAEQSEVHLPTEEPDSYNSDDDGRWELSGP